MQRAAILVGIFAFTLVTMWGWSNSSSRNALVDRVKSLEDKTAKLDSELRSVIAIRDQAKQQLAKAETHIQKLQQVVKERDELKIQLQVRTSERDQVLAQYDEFRKSLKDMHSHTPKAMQPAFRNDKCHPKKSAGCCSRGL